VSVPSERLSTPALTDKDRRDVPRVLAMEADYVAQSFVRSGEDLRQLRALLGPDGPPIVAKIETRPAVDDFDAILDEAGAVMIARGDLGVELPYEEIPLIQKQLVRRALERGVPSIVATQMLESMTAAPRPTRAEASDVANAVFDGADAVMLSAETAIGAYPVLAAGAAVRIVRACEEQGSDELPDGSGRDDGDASRAVAKAAVTLVGAEHGIAAIACYTRTGRTAQLLSALRPRVPIVAFSPDPAVVRRLGLVHGVEGRPVEGSGNEPNHLALLATLARREGIGGPGSPVVIVASTGAPGSGPNAVEVIRV
jgi:pyruvate kinase